MTAPLILAESMSAVWKNFGDFSDVSFENAYLHIYKHIYILSTIEQRPKKFFEQPDYKQPDLESKLPKCIFENFDLQFQDIQKSRG